MFASSPTTHTTTMAETTRVLLRVKRRRAASATAAARIDDDDDDGPPTSRTRRTNDNDDDDDDVPDRIRFVLPRDDGGNVAPAAAAAAEANGTSILGGKRGRTVEGDGEDHRQREITELMRGLVSAAVIRRNYGEDTTTTTVGYNDPRLAPLDDDELALLRQRSNSDEKLTTLGGSPWRVGKSSLRGNKSREFSKGDEKTTPEQQTMTGGDDDDDDNIIGDEMVTLPAPPTKTKRHRTIAFRRMKPGVITKKEREGRGSPRWVRVVDVTLDEDTSYDDGNDGLLKKLDAKMIDNIGGETTVPTIGRSHRSRTRPNDDTAKGEDDREKRNNNKRRKLGLTVVGSRTVLESDFLREEGRQQRQQHQSTVPIVSTTTTATEEDNDDVLANEPGGIVERRDDTLDSEVVRLIEWSLIALHNQGGGSIMPHLAFLKDDPRLLAYRRMNTGMCCMIDVALVNGVNNMPGNDGACGGKGRTVLHIAAMWGDVGGVKESMAMGASVTAVDARGDTPGDLAKRAGHDDVVTALMEGGKRERKTVNGNGNGDDGARISDGTGNGVEEVEYYYEMYCRDSRFRHPEMLGDDMPDLERSSVMSWEEEDEEDNWTSIEKLQKGFGFLNERGELVLEAGKEFNKEDDDDEEFLRLIYNNGDVDDDDVKGDDIEHDSNDEGYDGNDYPDDEENDDSNECDDDHRDADSWSYAGKSSRCSSEDDDDSMGWKKEFRNRFVSQDMLDYGYEYEGINDGIDLLDDE